MRGVDTGQLVEDCQELSESLAELLSALYCASGELDEQSLSTCLKLCISIVTRWVAVNDQLFAAFHQLNIVNNAVNGINPRKRG